MVLKELLKSRKKVEVLWNGAALGGKVDVAAAAFPRQCDRSGGHDLGRVLR